MAVRRTVRMYQGVYTYMIYYVCGYMVKVLTSRKHFCSPAIELIDIFYRPKSNETN